MEHFMLRLIVVKQSYFLVKSTPVSLRPVHQLFQLLRPVVGGLVIPGLQFPYPEILELWERLRKADVVRDVA